MKSTPVPKHTVIRNILGRTIMGLGAATLIAGLALRELRRAPGGVQGPQRLEA